MKKVCEKLPSNNKHALISPITNKNFFFDPHPLYLPPHFCAPLCSYNPWKTCLWLLAQISLFLFPLEYTTIRLSSLHCFVKATNDLRVLNLKLNSLFICHCPPAEFDTADHCLFLETLFSLGFQDNIAFLFLPSTSLTAPSVFLAGFSSSSIMLECFHGQN